MQKLGELHFQQAYLVIFPTVRLGFSQNLLKGSKFCLENIVCAPLIFLRALFFLLLDRTSSNGIEQSMGHKRKKEKEPPGRGETKEAANGRLDKASRKQDLKETLQASIAHARQARSQFSVSHSIAQHTGIMPWFELRPRLLLRD